MADKLISFNDLQALIDAGTYLLKNPFTPSTKLADKLEVLDALLNISAGSNIHVLADNQLVSEVDISSRPTVWVGIDGYCETVPVYETYYEHEVHQLEPPNDVCSVIRPDKVRVWCIVPGLLHQGNHLYLDNEGLSPFVGNDGWFYIYGSNDDYVQVSALGRIIDLDIC